MKFLQFKDRQGNERIILPEYLRENLNPNQLVEHLSSILESERQKNRELHSLLRFAIAIAFFEFLVIAIAMYQLW